MKISISIHLRSIVIHGPATRLLHPTYLNITLEEHAGSRIDPKIGTKLKTTDQLPPPPPFFLLPLSTNVSQLPREHR